MTPRLSVYLKKRAERRIRAGHLWIFSNEIQKIEGDTKSVDGTGADFYNHRGGYLGCGYLNRHSLISGRLLSRQKEPDEEELFRRRILSALTYRSRFYPSEEEAYRLIYSEGDFLPGLIVDKFGSWLVVQCLTAGIELRREMITRILTEYLSPKGIVFRNDSSFRKLEGLRQKVHTIGTEPPSPLSLRIEGMKFSVDLEKGQKTGHFFDQSWNRLYFGTLVGGYNVLDTFCYSGGWSLQALAGGALHVTAVDSSSPALDLAKTNVNQNGFGDNFTAVKSDVFDYFKSIHSQNKLFDAIVLDPPAFAKSRKDVRQAVNAYRRLNRMAITCLHRGGILATCSCSYHISAPDFVAVVAQAAASLGRFARLIHAGGQSPDHPVPPGLPEASYLKSLFLQVD